MSFRGTLKAPLSTFESPAMDNRRGDQTAWLFLSLYLVLFAFFVVLNSFSSFDRGRRDAVIDSVLDAFTTVVSTGDEMNLGGFAGLELQARRFQDAVTDIFETAIPLANLKVTAPGTRMEVNVPTQAWFEGDSVVVRDPLPMLDRIVATVSSPPQGLSYEMVLVGLVPGDEADPLPTEMTPEVARIGNVARALDAKGMPPEAMSIGLEHGDSRFFRVIFFALEEQSRIRSGLSLGQGVGE